MSLEHSPNDSARFWRCSSILLLENGGRSFWKWIPKYMIQDALHIAYFELKLNFIKLNLNFHGIELEFSLNFIELNFIEFHWISLNWNWISLNWNWILVWNIASTGLPYIGRWQWSAPIQVPSFKAHVRHYMRASCGLVDVKLRKQNDLQPTFWVGNQTSEDVMQQ